MEKEVKALLGKETIDCVPPPERGFYTRYFIVPIKDEELCPILDLRQLNHTLKMYKFKMLMLKHIVT